MMKKKEEMSLKKLRQNEKEGEKRKEEEKGKKEKEKREKSVGEEGKEWLLFYSPVYAVFLNLSVACLNVITRRETSYTS